MAGGTGPVSGEVFLEAQLDDPVQVISQPQPRYPPVLASAGITEADVRPIAPSLEDVFVALTASANAERNQEKEAALV